MYSWGYRTEMAELLAFLLLYVLQSHPFESSQEPYEATVFSPFLHENKTQKFAWLSQSHAVSLQLSSLFQYSKNTH